MVSVVDHRLGAGRSLVEIPVVFVIGEEIASGAFQQLVNTLLRRDTSQEVEPVLIIDLPVISQQVLPQPGKVAVPGFGEAVGFVLLCFRNVVFRHEVAAASVDVVDAEAGFKVKPVQDIPVQEGAAHDTFFPVVIVCIMECGDGIGRRGAFGIHKTPVFIVGTLHGTDGIGSFHHRAVFVLLMTERGRQIVPEGQPFADLVAIVGTQGEAVVGVSGDDAVLLVISSAEVVAHLLRSAADAELIVAYGSHTEDFVEPVGSFAQ